jgi:nucleoside-diphosphate-sugar epimerase
MNKKIVLLIGGNGYIGCEIAECLLNHNEDIELVLVNRGDWSNWDSAERIKCRIKQNIIFDREEPKDPLHLKKELAPYLNKENFKFEAVIDLSAYNRRSMQTVLDNLPPESIKVYIYISSDSIYEICIDKRVNEGEEVVLDEVDSIRPESKEDRKRLKSFDSYGHGKLKYNKIFPFYV